jgi:phenylacetate-CoA ligase
MYLPLLRTALATRGVVLDAGLGHVAIVNVCMQRSTFTFASVSSFLGWAGCAKVNLSPTEWRYPDDCLRFLEHCDPQVYTGDPLAFATLAALPLAQRPRALVSTSMALGSGLRQQLEVRFGCPVIDLYSLTESGPVAVDTEQGFRILPHDLYVEVLDSTGRPCAPGEHGEIALTGGRNPFFPLLRYRTGDWASLAIVDNRPHLLDLEGRPPAIFRDTAGRLFNNVDVTHALAPLGLPMYRLHQDADGHVTMRVAASVAPSDTGGGLREAIRHALQPLFGVDASIDIGEIDVRQLRAAKVVPYSSDISLPTP